MSKWKDVGRVMVSGSGKEPLVYWEENLSCLFSVSNNWFQNLRGFKREMSDLVLAHSWCPRHLVRTNFNCLLFPTVVGSLVTRIVCIITLKEVQTPTAKGKEEIFINLQWARKWQWCRHCVFLFNDLGGKKKKLFPNILGKGFDTSKAIKSSFLS